jgi:hypothetical protein
VIDATEAARATAPCTTQQLTISSRETIALLGEKYQSRRAAAAKKSSSADNFFVGMQDRIPSKADQHNQAKEHQRCGGNGP